MFSSSKSRPDLTLKEGWGLNRSHGKSCGQLLKEYDPVDKTNKIVQQNVKIALGRENVY